MKFDIISVIGLGYIGLPTAAMFASHGINVSGVDISSDAVETINRGNAHIYEPGLEDLVKQSVRNGKLKAIYVPEQADAFLITVPTPFKLEEGKLEPDLSFIKAACKAIAPVLRKGNLIVLESTSPVGTTEQLCAWLSRLRPDLIMPNTQSRTADVFVAYCPERVLPGKIINELIHNDRIIGGITSKCSEAAVALYKLFVLADCHMTNARTAEMAKLTENASRDVQIAFANELSMICDAAQINVNELITLANKHPRVNILTPGPGVGGHCIAVDPWFIVSEFPSISNLIATARKVNTEKEAWVFNSIQGRIEEIQSSRNNNEKVKLAIFGIAYKENINDFRESPSLNIALKCQADSNLIVKIVEPHKTKLIDEEFDFVSVDHALSWADLNVILVNHQQFENMPFPKQKTISYCQQRGN